MLAQFIFLVFCFNFAFSACLHGSIEWQSSCLFFKIAGEGFADAELTCRHLGGHLVSIHDAFTNAVVGQEASKHFQQSAMRDFWIGGNKLQSNATWTWVDNTTFDYTDWKKGQPKNYECVAQSWEDGYWSAQNCFKLKPYVCAVLNNMDTTTTTMVQTTSRAKTTTTKSTTTTKRPTTISTSSPTSGNCDDGWLYYAPTKSCYGGFVADNQNWNTSEIRCQNLGGHLPSVHSMDELRFIDSNYVLPLFRSVWLGFYSIDSGNTWQWSDGTPFDYTAWNDGFPQQIQGRSCGAIDSYKEGDPWYANVDCNQVWYSVCKKPSF